MLTLYLVCLMFGGTLLALSFLSGGGHETDHGGTGGGGAHIDSAIDGGDVHAELGSGDVDVHTDIGNSDVDIHADAGIAADAGVADTHAGIHSEIHDVQHGQTSSGAVQQVEGQEIGEAFKFISLRSLIFFTAFFGLTGSLLTWLGISSAVTLLSSLGIGGFASVLTHRLMNYFKRTESGETIDVYKLTGHAAKVLLSPTKTVKGKILLESQGHTLTLLALLDDSSTLDMLPLNSWALIVRVDKNAVYVIEADYM